MSLRGLWKRGPTEEEKREKELKLKVLFEKALAELQEKSHAYALVVKFVDGKSFTYHFKPSSICLPRASYSVKYDILRSISPDRAIHDAADFYYYSRGFQDPLSTGGAGLCYPKHSVVSYEIVKV